MSRVDVTSNQFKTFEALAADLRENGFQVDHFHGVDIVEWANGEVTGEVTHFNEYAGQWENDRGFEGTPQGWHRLVADEWHE